MTDERILECVRAHLTALGYSADDIASKERLNTASWREAVNGTQSAILKWLSMEIARDWHHFSTASPVIPRNYYDYAKMLHTNYTDMCRQAVKEIGGE